MSRADTRSDAHADVSAAALSVHEAPTADTLLATRDLVIDIPERADSSPLHLTVNPGQCWGILGPNGAGKSTLLHTLARLRPARAGRIELTGQPLGSLSRPDLARRLGLVFQNHHDGFPATVLETALIGRHPYLRPWDIETGEDVDAARAALATVDLDGMEGRQVDTLSGGERQRLALATVLTQDPQVLLLDEPTSQLDLHHQVSVLQRVREIAGGERRAAVMALHDVNLAARFCDHLLLMFPDGGACWGPTRTMLVPAALERLYNQALSVGEVDGHPVFLPRVE